MNESKKITRREFIQRFSAFAASLPWISLLINETSAYATQPAVKIRLGVIGTGSRGKKLMLHLLTIPNCEISAICDIYSPHLYDAKRLTGGQAKMYEDYRNLLENDRLDGVVIATPLHLHAQMAIDSLNAGKHVFCEKCMARTMEDCYRMVQTQRETGKILQIGYQRPFDLRYLKAIELVKAGEIGPITMIRAYWHRNGDWRRDVPRPELERQFNWRLYDEYSGGLMTELGSHQIQVANWLLDSHPQSVSGAGSINHWNDGREVYDNVSVVFSYPNGVQFCYDSLTSNRFYGLEEQVMGPKGTLELESGKIYTETPPPAPGILQLINQIENRIFDSIPLGGASWVPETALEQKGEYLIDSRNLPDATQLEMEGYVKSIQTGQPVPGMMKLAFYASVAALLANNAMQKKQLIQWPEGMTI